MRAQVPDFRSSGKIPAHGWPPCSTGGVRLSRSQQKDQKISTLETALAEKDTTITRLARELADITHNWEGQLKQLLWLNTIVNEKEVELFDKDLTVSALESTVSDQAITINNLSLDYAEMQAKFITIYNHCKNLAMDRQKKEDHIAMLLIEEEKAKEITVQQRNLIKSLVALKEKEKTTKFIDGNHSFYHGQTEPSLQVRQEMSLAAARVRKEKEEQERADLIKSLVALKEKERKT